MPDDYLGKDKGQDALAEQHAVDFADLQNELADRNTGKINRFLSDSDMRGADRNDKKRKHEATLFDLLMQDALYRQTYEDTYQALGEAETFLHDALTLSADKLRAATSALEDARENGALTEELKRLKRNYEAAQEHHVLLVGYDGELQSIRDRMQDQDNPLSQADLEGYKERIGEIKTNLEADRTLDQSLEIDRVTSDQGAPLDLSGFKP